MAKTKAELIKEAGVLGIEVDSKLKVAEIQALINNQAKNEIATATETEVAEETIVEPKVAKSGKRSEKSLKEAAQKQAKEERKASGVADEISKPKQPVKPTRSRLERRGKKFRKSAELIDKSKTYSLEDAVNLAIKTNPAKFDASVELHVNLNVDPKQADQNVRDNLVLPAGTGKTVRVAVFSDDNVDGADVSGVEVITKALDRGEPNFNVLVATPANMPKLGKYARLLGPRGLMPNPKSGTVTTDLSRAVAEAKAGRVEYRVDSTGIIHLSIGKVSFTPPRLLENANAVLTNLRSNKPNGVKGAFVKSVYLTTTMGPSIPVDAANM